MKPLVSVVVIARNEEATLPRLLDGLAAQTIGVETIQIVVVDDGSDDDTARVAKARGIASVLSTSGRLGDGARNVGVQAAEADVIAITDADCVPAADWLEQALADLQRLGVSLLAGHIDVPLSPRPSIAEIIDFCRHLDQERAVREIACSATANLVLRREVFDRVGLFNERLFAGGDIEFGRRAIDAGFQIAYSPRASVSHPPQATARGLMRRCYRGGVASAALRRYGSGSAATQTHVVWRHPGAYKPSRTIYGIERLRATNLAPGWWLSLRLSLGQWVYAQLPIVAGSIAGSLRRR